MMWMGKNKLNLSNESRLAFVAYLFVVFKTYKKRQSIKKMILCLQSETLYLRVFFSRKTLY